MAALKRSSLKNYVYEYIRKKILNGDLAPGERINISEIVNDLEVSTAPVREAISQLESEKLIETIPFIGARVPDWSEEDFYNHRIGITAFFLGCFTMCQSLGLTDKLVTLLEKSIDAQRKIPADASPYDITMISKDFENSFADVLENPTITNLCRSCNHLSFVESIRDYRLGLRSISDSLKYHQHIIDTIKTNDYSEVKKVMLDHMRISSADLK